MDAIDGANVEHDVNHVAAQFVALHIDWGAVGGHVELAHHVKQECLFNAGILTKSASLMTQTYGAENVEQVFVGSQARNKLLNDFGKGFEDGVVVDAGQVKVELDRIQSGIGQFV
jgi:hypothetical protein